MNREPIPAWVITGPLGCGKTTVIAEWLAAKDPAENWVVLLNEYSDAGIDTLTVAASARGAFDVRLVPGGCLCCTGEADFRRNLTELIEHIRPSGILVEPSGIGHPGGIVEELLAHQAAGGIRLCGVIGLIDPSRIDSADENVIAVREIADALLLSKADLASATDISRFRDLAAGLFPAKAWVGELRAGKLPIGLRETLNAASAGTPSLPHEIQAVRQVPPPAHAQEHAHAHEHAHASEHAPAQTESEVHAQARRREFHHLGRHGARWILPRSLAFSETRLLTLLSSELALVEPGLCRPERFKAVLRVDEDSWLLVQMVEGRLAMQPSAWRRDNRIELQLPPGATWDVAAWERLWRRALQA